MFLKEKKSQAWSIDLMVAIAIFSIGIVVFYAYSINGPGESEENMQNLFYDGEIITNTILSEGYPINWNETNVDKIGLLTDNKINKTKLEYFYDLTQKDYEKTKLIFNTKYNYYLFFDKNITINSNSIEGIGKPGINKNNINTENLIKITRITVFENKPATAYLYIWI
jgi:hypothetical protein